mmetsp:Transcript_43735/g.114954  ORF Transcript_43735/g.114954 Transcript_43735/m.114954 type:complete len:292 (+) Transcript_43735:13-888(+)
MSSCVISCVVSRLARPGIARARGARMKLKDDDVVNDYAWQPSRVKNRSRVSIGACAIFSLLLCMWLITDAMAGSEDSRDSQQIRRRPMIERAVERMEELATVVVPVPKRDVLPPCAVNVSGYLCPNAYGEALNQVYFLESSQRSASAAPVYRSLAGYFLVHSPRSCLSRGAWILTRSLPDESETAMQGACDIEAHIFAGAELPVGTREWSYASCGAAGGVHAGNRRLTIKLVQRCDCATAGDASDMDKALTGTEASLASGGAARDPGEAEPKLVGGGRGREAARGTHTDSY